MNYYVVTEGTVEAVVYKKWIPLVRPSLTFVGTVAALVSENCLIISGGGYPFFLGVIKNAIDEIGLTPVDARLVVCVDSEDASYQQKFDEIDAHIMANQSGGLDYRIVVQHFCFEAWALGNRKIPRKIARDPDLLEYRRHHDVLTLDPENLPPLDDFNRAQLAEVYLRRVINDRNSRLSYSKHNPSIVAEKSYFSELSRRFIDTGHIKSFKHFEQAFL
jgi:hypothetical protein